MELDQSTADLMAAQKQHADQRTADAKAIEELLDKRRPIEQLLETLYVSRPYPYAADVAKDEAWLKGWAKRLAKLGDAITRAGCAGNVNGRSGTGDLAEQQTLAILKTCLDGDATKVLALLRGLTLGYPPITVQWHGRFNSDALRSWIFREQDRAGAVTRQVTEERGTEPTDKLNGQTDSEKKIPKKSHKMNDAARKCAKDFKRDLRTNPEQDLKDFVASWVFGKKDSKGNSLKSTTMYKRLCDNREEWDY